MTCGTHGRRHARFAAARRQGWWFAQWLIVAALVACAAADTACASAAQTPLTATSTPQTLSDGSLDASTTYGTGACTWVITAQTAGRVVKLVPQDWVLQTNNDHITIYDGATTRITRLYDSMRYVDRAIYSSGNVMKIVLFTDSFTHAGGFSFLYSEELPGAQWAATQTLGPRDLSAVSSDTFALHLPRSNYGVATYPRQNVSFTLTLSDSAFSHFAIGLKTTARSLASGDYISIYDGNSESAPLLVQQGHLVETNTWVAPTATVVLVTLTVTSEDNALYTDGITVLIKGSKIPFTCNERMVVDLSTTSGLVINTGNGHVFDGVPISRGAACEWELRAPTGYRVNYSVPIAPIGSKVSIFDDTSTNVFLPGGTYVPGGANPTASIATSNGGLSISSSALVQFQMGPLPGNVSVFAYAVPDTRCGGSVNLDASGSNVVINEEDMFQLDHTCEWIIQGAAGKSFSVIVSSDLQLNVGDTLTVSTIASDNTRTVVRTLSSSSSGSKQVINAAAPRLAINLHTSTTRTLTPTAFNIVARVFTAQTMCPAGVVPVTIDGSTKQLAAPPNNADSNVGSVLVTPNTVCSWHISAASQFFRLDLQMMSLRPGVDRLRVYEGGSTSSPLLFDYAALTTPSPQQQFNPAWTGTELFVTLETGPGDVGNAAGVYLTAGGSGYPIFDQCGTNGVVEEAPVMVEYDYFPRLTTCLYRLRRTLWSPGMTGYAINGLSYVSYFMGFTISIYDGANSSAPVLWTSDSPLPQIDQSSVAYLESQSSELFVNITSGSLKYRVGSVLYLNLLTQSSGLCSGLQMVSAPLSPCLYIYPSTQGQLIVPPNLTCEWLVTAASSGVFTVIAPAASSLGDLVPGESTLELFDGNSTDAPMIPFDRLGQTRYGTTGTSLFIRFTTAPTAQIQPTIGFALSVRSFFLDFLCHGHTEQHFADPSASPFQIVHGDLSTFSELPYAARTCSWRITAAPGMLLASTQIVNTLTGDDVFEVFDGYNASSPLLARITAGAAVAPFRSSGTALFARLDTTGSTRWGIVITIQPFVPLEPNRTKTMNQETIWHYTTGQIATLSSLPRLRLPPSAPCDDVLAALSPKGFQVYDYEIRRTQTLQQKVTITVTDFTNATLEVWMDGNPSLRAQGAVLASAAFSYNVDCGVMRVRLTSRQAGLWGLWRVAVEADVGGLCRRSDDVACMQSVTLDTTFDPIWSGCTILNDLIYHTLTPLPNLRDVVSTVLVDGNLATSTSMFPALETAGSISIACDPCSNLTAVEFSALQMSGVLTVTGSALQALEFPVLRVVGGALSITPSGPQPVAVNLDALYSAGTIIMQSVRTISFPSLVYAASFYCTSAATDDFSAPLLEMVAGTITVGTATISQLALPSVISLGGLSLYQLPLLSEVSLPRLFAFSGNIDLESSTRVVSVQVPLLTVAYASCIKLDSVKATVISLPSLSSVKQLQVTNNRFLTRIDAPLLMSCTTFLLQSTLVLPALSLPSLATSTSFSLIDNPKLASLGMCSLVSVTSAVVTNAPSLSCIETAFLFNDAGANLAIAPPNCLANARGTFGCRVTTFYANATTCGNLSCIQTLVDWSYFDKQTQVVLSPGTFTGCDARLTFLGKRITISGDPAGGTVIDCRRTDRALTFEAGENAASELRDITLMNGFDGEGGLVIIDNAAPTFRRVRFTRTHITTARGAAVAVLSGGGTSFIDCTFDDVSSGVSGGAVAIIGGAATLTGCTFSSAEAVHSGGALFITGSPVFAVILEGCLFANNTAAQGGAVFTDTSILLTDCTFSANLATQNGGGLAIIPASNVVTDLNELHGCVFTGNTGATGGGLYVFSSNLVITGSNFTRNEAPNGEGGGLSALCSCAFRLLYGVSGVCDMWVNLTSTVFVGNTAGTSGGGVSAQDVHVIINGMVGRGNQANTYGGTLYADSAVMVRDGIFVGNSAGNAGGGVYITSTLNCAVLESVRDNNYFANNTIIADAGYGYQIATEASILAFTLNAPAESRAVAQRSTVDGGTRCHTDLVSTASVARFVIGDYLASTIGGTTLDVDLFDALNQLARGVLTPLVLSIDCGATQADFIGNKATLLSDATASFNVYITAATPFLSASTNCTLTLADSADTSRITVVPLELVMQCPARYGVVQEANGGATCRACAAGSTVASELGAECIACPAGTYSNGDVCVTCPADSYAPTSGRTSCRDCPGAAAGATDCVTPLCDPTRCDSCDTQQFCVTCQGAFANPSRGCVECSNLTLTQFGYPDCRLKRVNQFLSAGLIAGFLVLLAIPTVAWGKLQPLAIQHDVTLNAKKDMPFTKMQIEWPMSQRLLTVRLTDVGAMLTAHLMPDDRPFLIEPPSLGSIMPTTFHIELTQEEAGRLDARKLSVAFRHANGDNGGWGSDNSDHEMPLNFPVRKSLENGQVLVSTMLEFVQLAAVGFSPYIPWAAADPVISGWRDTLVLLPDVDFFPAIYWTVVGAVIFYLLAMLVIINGWEKRLADQYRSLKLLEALISARYLPLIGSTLFLTVVGVLVSGLSCSRFVTADDTTPYVISSHRTVECWTPAHAPYALFSFVLLALFVPVAVHYLPLWQVLLPNKDIRLHGEYMLLTSQAKYFMVGVAALFEGTNYVQIVAVILFITPLLIYLVFRPNSVVPFMRPFQIGLYLGVLWTAVASIVAIFTPSVLTSSIVLYVGWGLILVGTVVGVRFVARRTSLIEEKELDVNDTVNLVRKGLAGNRDFADIRSADFSREFSQELSDGPLSSHFKSTLSGSQSGSGSASQHLPSSLSSSAARSLSESLSRMMTQQASSSSAAVASASATAAGSASSNASQ